MAAETEYNYLKDREELFDLFPSFTGIWSKDEKVFQKYYDDNMAALSDIQVYDMEDVFTYLEDDDYDNPI